MKKADRDLATPLPKNFPPIKRNARLQIEQLMTRRRGQEYGIEHGIVFLLSEILKVSEEIRDRCQRWPSP